MTSFPKVSSSSGKVLECQFYINISTGRWSTCRGASIVFYKTSIYNIFFPWSWTVPQITLWLYQQKNIMENIVENTTAHTIEINNMHARITQQAKPQRKQAE